MKDKPTNLAASVLGRLKNVAREKNTDYQFIQRSYAIERLLHRLSLSPHRDQFILKGAMLFTAWLSDPFLPTQDLDLLGYGDPTTSGLVMRSRQRQRCWNSHRFYHLKVPG